MTAELESRTVADVGSALEVAGATDRGTVRTENQDAWDAFVGGDGTAVLVLADGMGGHPGGGEAATAALTAAVERLRAGVTNGGDAEGAVRAAVAAAGEAVATFRDRIGGNPGTTLVIAVIGGDGAGVVANVGDSRAYLIRGGAAQPLTEDHSWVGERVRAGELSPGEARHHPRRNIITRAVMGDPVQPDVYPLSMRPGDTVLLCSDGVWEPLPDAMLAELLTDAGPLRAALERSCEAAIDAGGTDNVTVVAAHRLS